MTRDQAMRFLTTDADTGEDTGYLRVPCSRYGRTGAECAPAAYEVARIIAGESGTELSESLLDYVMGLVVNDSDSPAETLISYGAQYGVDPEDYGAELPPRFVVVENDPGYLPENEPAGFDSYSDAVEYAEERAEEYAEDGYALYRVASPQDFHYLIQLRRPQDAYYGLAPRRVIEVMENPSH